MNKHRFESLYKELENSMIGYEVNGNPMQRTYTLRNIAYYLLKKHTTSIENQTTEHK